MLEFWTLPALASVSIGLLALACILLGYSIAQREERRQAERGEEYYRSLYNALDRELHPAVEKVLPAELKKPVPVESYVYREDEANG